MERLELPVAVFHFNFPKDKEGESAFPLTDMEEKWIEGHVIPTLRKLEVVDEKWNDSPAGRKIGDLLRIIYDIESDEGNNNFAGVTLAVYLTSGEVAYSICKQPDQFSRAVGRTVALTRLCDKLQIHRHLRVFDGRNLILYPVPRKRDSTEVAREKSELLVAAGRPQDMRRLLSGRKIRLNGR